MKTTMNTVARRNNSQRCVRSLASHATMARLPGDVRDPSVALLPTTGPRPTQNSEFTQPSTAAMWAAAQVSVGGGAVGRKKSQPGHCRFRSKHNSTALDFCKRCQGRGAAGKPPSSTRKRTSAEQQALPTRGRKFRPSRRFDGVPTSAWQGHSCSTTASMEGALASLCVASVPSRARMASLSHPKIILRVTLGPRPAPEQDLRRAAWRHVLGRRDGGVDLPKRLLDPRPLRAARNIIYAR